MTKSHTTVNVSLIAIVWGNFLTGFTRYCDRDHKSVDMEMSYAELLTLPNDYS